MKVVTAAEVPKEQTNKGGETSRTGTYEGQRLIDDDARDGLNFVFLRNRFFPDGGVFQTPRHRHSFAQIKFVEKGASNFAPDQYIHEGDIAYFPRGAYYGPQLKDNATSISLQFGFNGEHQKGKVWESFRAEAVSRLKARGTLGDGVFTEVDPATGAKRQRDGVEAIYDEQYQLRYGADKKFVVAPGGYEAPVLMHPKAFPYHPFAPGVELKHLGQFYDQPGPNGDVRISMARLSGGTYSLGPERARLAWALAPGLRVNGLAYPELTFVYSARDEHVSLSGDGGVEVFLVTFPRLD